MKSRWKLREPYFRGANTYKIGPKDGEQLEIAVDENGLFELEKPPEFPIYMFARSSQ